MIVFVDENEKAFAGTGTDMSGVKTEMTGTMLSWMQDRGADGLIFIATLGRPDRHQLLRSLPELPVDEIGG
jgi:hypothetical protein